MRCSPSCSRSSAYETSSVNLVFTGRRAGPPQACPEPCRRARPDPPGGSIAVLGERGVVMTTEPILSARGIVNRFGKQEVHDKLDLDVMRGEIIGIAGGSGSGKSVLLKTLIGLHRPNAGTVNFCGRKVEQL